MNTNTNTEIGSVYEILVPTGFKLKHHHAWGEKVREIAGGLTVYRAARGQWVSPNGDVYTKRMIPVRVLCSEAQIMQICDFTAKHYKQKAIMFYLISKKGFIKHYYDD